MATMPIYSPVDNSWFDHINIDHTNWDGRCPLEDDIEEINNSGVLDPESEHMSWLLSQILDRRGLAGTRDIVSTKRKVTLMTEYIDNTGDESGEYIIGGSYGEGFNMVGGDVDKMDTFTDVIVTYRDQYHLLPDDSRHKTVLFMREADCQPGYVALELASPGQRCIRPLSDAVVPIWDSMYISSDMFRQGFVDSSDIVGLYSNGPCGSITIDNIDIDYAFSFPCTCWPKEAEEWVNRTRLYGWPSQELRDKIVQSGCHLVPVGDKSSSDTFLQWRISFLTAERRLVYSLNHQQFRIYGLLKYFLKQIKDLLEHLIGESDILCSYFIKTLIFHAVENSPSTLWQHKHTFFGFRFCLRILMEWIKNGNCPNYFIKNNNMFKRKVHGESQQKLLHILTDMYHIKWASLSVGTVYQPSIGELLHQAHHRQLPSRKECEADIAIFSRLTQSEASTSPTGLVPSLRLLSESQSDTDEFIAYHLTATRMSNTAMSTCTTPCRNKQKYRDIRKAKRLLTPMAAMCISPGLLYLATFHYHTGSYRKCLEMCGEVTSSPRYYVSEISTDSGVDRYQHMFCGRGYSLFHKLKERWASDVIFCKETVSFCIPHLHLELASQALPLYMAIPPLPYAVFLSFLCYHDLGDTRRRDAALLHLRAVNYDPEQGGHKHWIVHTLLGICYQTVGDNRRAIRSYTDSVHVEPEWNPAMERIEPIRCSE